MKRQKYRIGAIVEIPIIIGTIHYCYGQISSESIFTVFDYCSPEKIIDYQTISELSPLFNICIYNHIITKGEWTIVSVQAVKYDVSGLYFYIHHSFDELEWEKYEASTGKITPSCREECKDMELCAVWDKNHVEDRLISYYSGSPCIWLSDVLKLFPERKGRP